MSSSASPQVRRAGIGPGALVAVCGPSGAGKDSLLRRVQDTNAHVERLVFPRRIVTRPVTAHEDHDTATVEEFDRMLSGGGFAVWWEAHGLKYGLAASIDDDIRAGRCVVCNVSRTIVSQLRHRYAQVVTVLITAPHEILAARLVARARASDRSVSDRLARSAPAGAHFEADVVIDNSGSIDEGARTLLNVIESQFVVAST